MFTGSGVASLNSNEPPQLDRKPVMTCVSLRIDTMPLVLVQNPVIIDAEFDWKDILGEQYHFLNKYKNRCRTDTPFIYYRGTRRSGGKRADPEYFGHGIVGDVWRDDAIPVSRPKKNWAWYCQILDYVPFQTPVRAKIGGSFIETIPRNHWSEGVRKLPQDASSTTTVIANACKGAPTRTASGMASIAVQAEHLDIARIISANPLWRSVEICGVWVHSQLQN